MQIWKFEIPQDGSLVEMPQGARLLRVDEQYRKVMIWALVEPDAEKVNRHLLVYGTGHEVETDLPFVGTAFVGPLVWHVFDGGEV